MLLVMLFLMLAAFLAGRRSREPSISRLKERCFETEKQLEKEREARMPAMVGARRPHHQSLKQMRDLDVILTRNGKRDVQWDIFEVIICICGKYYFFCPSAASRNGWIQVAPPAANKTECQTEDEEDTQNTSGSGISKDSGLPVEQWFADNEEYLKKLAPEGTYSYIVPEAMLKGMSDEDKQEIVRHFILVYGAIDAELKQDGVHVTVPEPAA